MKYYSSYMDRQEIPEETHEKLLALTVRRRQARPWVKYGALAACAALIVGVGVWKLSPVSDPGDISCEAGQFAADYVPLPGESDTVGPGHLFVELIQSDDMATSFVVNSPTEDGKLMFPMVPYINYSNTVDHPDYDMSLSRIYAPGSFTVDVTKKDIQTIFWGPEGKPEAVHPKTAQGDLPWMLFWDGYTVHGSAWYDGQGRLMQLTIFGEQGQAEFELRLCPGRMPFDFDCVATPDRGDLYSEFNGVTIAGWSESYNRDDGGGTVYVCGSEFGTESGVGVRFVNRNSPMQAEYGGDEDMARGGAADFNALFVRQAITGGLYLDHLVNAESVPAWREEEFPTLAQARQELDFAPYLPAQAPEYYRGTEFYSRLSYQEGVQNYMSVYWLRGYDTVEVRVFRDGYHSYHLADPARPETYDLRLYTIPWSESVPREYRETVDHPAFRAEDMSLAIVEARAVEKDTGGLSFRFEVVHPDGTLVSYRCDRMTAQQVWELVEETL